MTMKTVEGRDGGQRDVHRQQQHCICDRLVLTHIHRQACKSRQTDRQTDRDTDGEKNERTTRRTTFLNSVALSHCTDVPCSRPVLFLGGPSKLVAISSHVLYILLFLYLQLYNLRSAAWTQLGATDAVKNCRRRQSAPKTFSGVSCALGE